MNIFWPENEVRSTVSGIITTIGRPFTVFIKTAGTPCPNCLGSGSYDPVTNSSVNSFCGLCEGEYWLNIPSGIVLTGHVKWNVEEIPRWTQGGISPDGNCVITILYNPAVENHIKNSDYFSVDNKILTLKGYKTRGVPNINRIIVTLQEQ